MHADEAVALEGRDRLAVVGLLAREHGAKGFGAALAERAFVRPCFRAGAKRMPRDGHVAASGQTPQRGTRARHTPLPRSISACAAAAENA